MMQAQEPKMNTELGEKNMLMSRSVELSIANSPKAPT
jgi:hypothetical protein